MANWNSADRTNKNAAGRLRIPISTQISALLIRNLTNHSSGFVGRRFATPHKPLNSSLAGWRKLWKTLLI